VVAGETVVLAYAVAAFVFAYLAINLSDEHGPLKILNILLTYFTIFITGFLSVSVLPSDSSARGVVTTFNNGYSWLFYIVVAYFMIYILYELFAWWKDQAGTG